MGSRTAAIKPSRIQRSHTDPAGLIADRLRISTLRHEGTGTFGTAAKPTRTSLPVAGTTTDATTYGRAPSYRLTEPRGPLIGDAGEYSSKDHATTPRLL